MKSLAHSLTGLRPAGYFPSQYTGPNLIPLEHQTPCVFSPSVCSLSAKVQDLCAVECGVSEQLLLLQHELFSTQTSLATGWTKPHCKAEARNRGAAKYKPPVLAWKQNKTKLSKQNKILNGFSRY